MTRTRACAAVAVWATVLITALGALVRVRLPSADGDPVLMAFAVLRVVAIAAGGYLGCVLVLGLVARAVRLASLVRVVDAVTVPAVRRLAAAAAGASLVASTALSMTPAGAAPKDNGGPPVMVVIPDDEPIAGMPAAPPPPAAPAQAVSAPASAEPDRAVVGPGDNLWVIAAHALEQAWGRPATNAELVPYWRALIDRNAAVFVRAGDPNLVFAGQVLDLPASPPAPS